MRVAVILAEVSNPLWSRPKELLALSRKLRICINSEKEDNLVRYTQIFETFFLEISVPFDFHPGISGILSWMVLFSEIQQYLDFLELLHGNFRTIWPRFQNVEIFGRMVSALYITCENNRPFSLPARVAFRETLYGPAAKKDGCFRRLDYIKQGRFLGLPPRLMIPRRKTTASSTITTDRKRTKFLLYLDAWKNRSLKKCSSNFPLASWLISSLVDCSCKLMFDALPDSIFECSGEWRLVIDSVFITVSPFP